MTRVKSLVKPTQVAAAQVTGDYPNLLRSFDGIISHLDLAMKLVKMALLCTQDIKLTD